MARPMFDKVLTLPRKKKAVARKEKAAKPPKREPKPLAPPTPLTVTLAWGVHLYTAMGLVCAAGMAALLVGGQSHAFQGAFALMALATLIDSTDGTLARKIRIKEVLPGFDGRKLDDITDFLTYTALPLALVWRAGLVPAGTEWSLVVPLLASAYGFCQCEAKTDDGYFLGFPSLWNVVAFYLYVLRLPPWAALAVLQGLALMTFVPSRYLYPSQPGKLNVVANVLGAVWTVMLAWVLWNLPGSDALSAGTADATVMGLAAASLFYPVFYLAASWAVTLKLWAGRGAAPGPVTE